MRPPGTSHNRFFIYYRSGKCTKQPIGINTFASMPKRIATFLGLENAARYTGHCFRRSSATILAEAGASLTTIKMHAGWKSSRVAEGYIENSINNKRKVANLLLGESDESKEEASSSKSLKISETEHNSV